METTTEIKIKEARMSVMTNEMHTQFYEDIGAAFHRRPDAVLRALGLDEIVPVFYQAFDAQKSVLDIITASKYSVLLHLKDIERDHAIRGFLGHVKNQRHHPDQKVREAAERVYKVFKHYGNILKRSYDEETAAINDILREFERADLVADLKTIQAEEWRNRAETANNEFFDLTQHRIVENAEMPTIRMKDARKVTDRVFRNIVSRLEFLVTLGKITPELTELVAEINSVVKHYKDLLAQKAGRNSTVVEP